MDVSVQLQELAEWASDLVWTQCDKFKVLLFCWELDPSYSASSQSLQCMNQPCSFKYE